MKVKLIYIAIVVLVFSQFSSFAQELDSKTRRTVNFEIFELIDEYERYGKLTDNLSYIVPEYKEKFKTLFADDATLFCDIKPENRMDEQFLVPDYIALLEKRFPQGVAVSLKVHDISFPKQHGDNHYSSIVEASKVMSAFSAYQTLQEDTFNIKLHVSYQVHEGIVSGMKLTNIEGPSGKFINILCTRGGGDTPLKNHLLSFTINEKTFTKPTNDEGILTLSGLNDKDIIVFDVPAKKTNPSSNTLKVGDFLANRDMVAASDPNTFRLGIKQSEINAGLALHLVIPSITEGDNKFTQESDQTVNNNISSGFGISAFVNYLLGNFKGLDLGVGLGLQYASIEVESSLDTWQTSYMDIDEESRTYQRSILLNDIVETTDLALFEIPVSLFLKYSINEKVAVTANLGIEYGMTLSASSTSTAQAYYSGLYGSEFFNIFIDDDRVYNFGHYSIDNPEENEPEFEAGIAPFFNLGVDYLLTNDTYLKIGGQYSLNPIGIKQSDEKHLSETNKQLNSTLSGYNNLTINKASFYIGISKYF